MMDFAPLPIPPAQQAVLEQAYADPPRAYHHFGHVEEVLGHCAQVAAGPGWTQPGEVFLAVLYHDAVYVAGRSDNERRSAQLAAAQIALGWPDAGIDVARVQQLIDLTARHGQLQPGDVDAQAALFLDCDMAILAATPERFAAYDAAIAQEYSGVVPAWLFRIKRRQFLRGVLQRERIYLSDWFHARLDAAARDNLRRAVNG